MRIFVAGASGAIGKQLVPMLLARGHQVTGTTRGSNLDAIEAMGADAVTMDGLDPESVASAVTFADPDVIVNELTALGGDLDLGNFDETFEETNRLRSEGTDHMLSAARAAGVRRYVAQSFLGWPFEKKGSWVKSEEDPLDAEPPEAARGALRAIGHLEDAVTSAGPEIEGLVLRYGGFYGPGTSFSINPDGVQTEMVRKRRFPLVGTGAGYWSLIHITDAATATVAAVEGGAPGIYNIGDDDPAPISVVLPEIAKAIGAKPPRHLPAWVARLGARLTVGGAAGEMMVMMMEEARGGSNAKAKRELGWQPYFASWRQGMNEGLAQAPPVELPSCSGATL